ncbi:MAG: hypothetical protein FWE02_04475 [Defluviitaleaceae bacterium]|nr:hypothetical protein [Defluviitaleaceae bacterium]
MLKNCPRCRKVANLLTSNICEKCIEEEEEIYKKVYEHLKENPGLSVAELSIQTGVSTKKILGYVRDERIQMIENVLSCKICGEKIARGSLCLDCEEKQKRTILESMITSMKKPETEKSLPITNSVKMHTNQRRKEKK